MTESNRCARATSQNATQQDKPTSSLLDSMQTSGSHSSLVDGLKDFQSFLWTLFFQLNIYGRWKHEGWPVKLSSGVIQGQVDARSSSSVLVAQSSASSYQSHQQIPGKVFRYKDQLKTCELAAKAFRKPGGGQLTRRQSLIRSGSGRLSRPFASTDLLSSSRKSKNPD